MINKLRLRVAGEESGFTLIELLVVLIIIGILMAIAIPSYLGFKDKANQRAASADVRSAVPSAEAYFSDNDTYVGMTIALLQGYDSGLKIDHVTGTATTYCIDKTVGGKLSSFRGPGGDVKEGAAAALC